MRGFTGAVIALAVVLGAGAASAQAVAVAPAPSRLFLHATLGGGYGHYWQIGGADREAGGGLIDVSFGAGHAFSENFVLGGSMNFLPFLAMQVDNHVSGSSRSILFSPGWAGSLMVAVLPEGRSGPWAVEASLGWGGVVGGTLWGGTGVFTSVAPAFRFFHAGAVHLGVQARLVYAQLFWTDNAAVRPLVALTLGLDWSWY